ncbi:MAG: PAS domain-containing protein [Lachnospiraceae bacterium]|nr:PAS domain-containing protein [Lachnospiraceae bacterium]
MRFFEASPILESALEMILLLDLQGTIFYANRTALEMLDYKDGLVGESIATVFPSIKQDGLNAPDKSEIVTGEQIKAMAYRGNRTCFQTMVKVIESSTEEGPCYICYVEDNSEKDLLEKKVQQTRQEAEEALKVKSEFVSNITHELKTPVNGILGNIRELGEQENDIDKLRLIRLVERGCADMTNIIGNVLDFSKLEAGKVVLEP